MTALSNLRRTTDLVPANLRAAARKVLMYIELARFQGDDTARDAAVDVWCELIGTRNQSEALVLASEIVNDDG